MNRPTPTPPRRGAGIVRVLSVPLLGGARGGFMVPMHAQERKEALHEPRAKAGASSTHSKRCRAAAKRLVLREAFGVRPACRRFPRFMVSMHDRKTKESLPEPQCRAGVSPACVGNADGTEALALARSPGRLEARPTLGPLLFMTTVRVRAFEGGGVLESLIHAGCGVGYN